LLIELNGSNAGTCCVNGLTISAGGSTLRGLVVDRFSGSGIYITTDNNIVAGNFIGSDAAGSSARGNNGGLAVGGQHNRIGGAQPADRNLISGNQGPGISIDLAASTQVLGNYIGTNKH